MVLCVVFGCGSRSDREKGIGFYRIPSVINNKSAFEEELTTERREKWIQAISRGDTKAKDVLKNERVCGNHFVSGKPSPHWNKHNVDWVPTLELGKKSYGREIDYEERLQDSLPCPLKKKIYGYCMEKIMSWSLMRVKGLKKFSNKESPN